MIAKMREVHIFFVLEAEPKVVGVRINHNDSNHICKQRDIIWPTTTEKKTCSALMIKHSGNLLNRKVTLDVMGNNYNYSKEKTSDP